MAVDKQIIQLPAGALAFDGDSYFVFQNNIGSTDYKIKASEFLTYIGDNGVGDFEIYSGTGAPSPAIGNPRDLYFRSNGSVYKKVGNAWQIKAPAIVSQAVELIIPQGSNNPVTLTNGIDFNLLGKDVLIEFKIKTGTNKWSTGGASFIYDMSTTSDGSSITTITFTLNDDPSNPGKVEQDTKIKIV